MIGLPCVIGVSGALEIAGAGIRYAMGTATLPGTAILAIDNASEPPLEPPDGVEVVRNPVNTGNYPLFAQALALAQARDAELLAVLHSDLWIFEQGWDTRLEEAFSMHPRLGLVGFVGSDELDENGGRGRGTVLNFQGRYGGGAAEAHGHRVTGLVPAAQVDGCAMVFRTEALAQVGFRDGFPPHHFYDRLLSCQMLESGWRVGVLGVACDHLSGSTVGGQAWQDCAREWCLAHGVADRPDAPGNWDYAVYREAERQFLTEYRDSKHFIPRREAW